MNLAELKQKALPFRGPQLGVPPTMAVPLIYIEEFEEEIRQMLKDQPNAQRDFDTKLIGTPLEQYASKCQEWFKRFKKKILGRGEEMIAR